MKGERSDVKAVMFVPYTAHSELALRLRESEEKMESLTGYRIKIVERGGTKLLTSYTSPIPGQARTVVEMAAYSVSQEKKRAERTSKTAGRGIWFTKQPAKPVKREKRLK